MKGAVYAKRLAVRISMRSEIYFLVNILSAQTIRIKTLINTFYSFYWNCCKSLILYSSSVYPISSAHCSECSWVWDRADVHAAEGEWEVKLYSALHTRGLRSWSSVWESGHGWYLWKDTAGCHFDLFRCRLRGGLAGEPRAPEVPGLEEEAATGQTDGDSEEAGPGLNRT